MSEKRSLIFPHVGEATVMTEEDVAQLARFRALAKEARKLQRHYFCGGQQLTCDSPATGTAISQVFNKLAAEAEEGK